jgi:NADPH-dependent 2,4-dienoyl-CoA reductase/sulfur reductase-like enzyme/nitrite reductase/ring-hydroxylating ferredoxin subunit
VNTEEIVAKTDELADGQMKEVKVRDRSVLLLRVDGEFKAYVAECPHHGAPLAEGVLHEGHVRCPWHQAVFDARSGRLIEPPALDDLPHYDVRVEGDDVIVVFPQEPAAEARPPAMARRDGDKDARTFAIIGAGAAGLAAAETLRQEGYQGRLVVLTREQHASYDRTDLSKRYLASAKQSRPLIRPDGFYADADVEVLLAREVTEVDAAARTITCGDGTSVAYDKLLIATGGVPRRLGVEGEDLANVFTLRSLADCERIRQAADGASRAVVVGASFIGMEVAAALRQRGLEVTVVAPEPVPFERVFGERIGRMYRHVHEKKGAAFRFGSRVERFDGADGAVRQAVLSGGERLDAELVVAGVGVRPATHFLKGVETNDDGSVTVDANLRAGEGLFAAGDVARFPDWRGGEAIRIEHWRLAQQHGRTAARNMLDQDAPYGGVPFFWTTQHKVITEYVGHTGGWEEIVFDGDPADREFVAWYLRGDRVRAAAGCGKSWEMAAIAEVLKRPEPPTVDQARKALEDMAAPQGA